MIPDFLVFVMLFILALWRFGDVLIEWEINKGIDKKIK